MNKSFKAVIVTPGEYRAGVNKFSVIYLLHGYSNDYSSWSKISPLEEYADSFHLIFVCPDGNYNSWYIDSRVKTGSKFDTYISKEVIAFIDSAYRTWSLEKGRVIIGSSMGGHGATTLLAKHPDLYCGAGSISGIMDLSEFPGEWDLAEVLGGYAANASSWTSNSFFSLCEKLAGKNKTLILDCGTSDFALPCNRKTHQKMLALNIAHEYFERPGGHTPFYARKALGIHVKYFSGILLKPGK
ncbi:MAG TPA: alpha/beta hydrolase family protein [Chitinivibrionales bacterium]|nr:alpha/beta hydrolase family protein [Chitinivibrionales bacterium]